MSAQHEAPWTRTRQTRRLGGCRSASPLTYAAARPVPFSLGTRKHPARLRADARIRSRRTPRRPGARGPTSWPVCRGRPQTTVFPARPECCWYFAVRRPRSQCTVHECYTVCCLVFMATHRKMGTRYVRHAVRTRRVSRRRTFTREIQQRPAQLAVIVAMGQFHAILAQSGAPAWPGGGMDDDGRSRQRPARRTSTVK